MTMFSQKELERLVEATEQILFKTGVKVEHKGIFKKLSDAGAICDASTGTVRFPPDILHKLLSTVPRSFKLGGINGFEKICSFDAEHAINGIVIDPWILDYPSGKARRPSLSDIERNTKIQQTLGVDSIYRMIMDVSDYNDSTSPWHALEIMLKNNDRAHVCAPITIDELKIILEALQISNGGASFAGKGLVQVAIPIRSPLTFSQLYGDLLIESLNAGCNIQVTVCGMTGATAPFSKMGAFLEGHAENVAFAAITQLLKPGASFMSMNSPSAVNMKTGHDLYYSIEKLIWKVASVELFQYHGLIGGVEITGSIPARYDMQTGGESALFTTFAQLCNAPYLSGLGSCYNANGLSSEMIIIQNSFLNAIKFAQAGLDMNDIEASLASIHEIGPDGNFLMDDMTLERIRGNELFKDEMFDYSCQTDAPSMLERAHTRVLEIERDFVSPVSGKIQDDLTRYFEKIYK